MRWTLEAFVLPALGAKRCDHLTTDELRKWLAAQAAEPARLRTKKGEKQRYRVAVPSDREGEVRRRRCTANKKLTHLRAALNLAWREGKIASDAAWRAVKPYREVDASRARYLTVAEATRLLNAAAPDLRRMLQAALLTGCRYAELAALTASDFNPDAGTVHVRISKSGKGRHIVLADEGIEFFRSLTAGRGSQDRLLLKEDGGTWKKSHQHRPMRAACSAAKITPPIDFHTARHTLASLSVMGAMPLMVLARNLGHSDTRMVEKHYGHLAPNYVTDEIRRTTPKFGIKPADPKVVAIG